MADKELYLKDFIMARPVGTTRAKKPIFKKEFLRLVNATNRSLHLQHTTKNKFIIAFTLLYITGCRVSEIILFELKDIELMIKNNEFSLKNNTKTNKPRLISFDGNRVQIGLLKKILPPDDGYLFKKNNSKEPIGVSSLKHQMNSFIHKVLGELYSTHSFRAGYITTAHKVGLSIRHIQEDIGHKNIATTSRYISVTQEEISQGKNSIDW